MALVELQAVDLGALQLRLLVQRLLGGLGLRDGGPLRAKRRVDLAACAVVELWDLGRGRVDFGLRGVSEGKEVIFAG